jgi:chemotaxis protein MotB
MRRRPRIEEPAHPDRWMVSYADFMTLLFALFVVLFASSYHDQRTIKRVSSALKDGFQEMGTFSDSNSVPGTVGSDVTTVSSASNSTERGTGRVGVVPESTGVDAVKLQTEISKALGKEIEHREIDMRVSPEGFVISLHELGFFNSGQAKLLPGAADKIKRIATVLMKYGLDMRVEGHSDNVPIHNAAFDSNWDLSTARATAVAMMLLNESGFDPSRMSIAGYAQYHPSTSNDTPEGRRANRRVDIVVVSAFKRIEARTP